MNRMLSVLMLVLLSSSMLVLALDVQPVKASGTVSIMADGSIDPPDASISSLDNVTYTLTGNITGDADGIEVERDNIIIDGAGYFLQGTTFGSRGLALSGRSNVTIKNTNIRNFYYGIYLEDSSNTSISGNKMTNSEFGVYLYDSSYNTVIGNNITANNSDGIYLYGSSYNTVSGNNITNNREGIYLHVSNNYNSISGNNITENDYDGVYLSGSNNTVSGNNITNNYSYGIDLGEDSSNNTIVGNNISNGIYLSGSSNYSSIVGNNITANGYYCIYLVGSNNAVSGNDITANNGGGIYLSGSNSTVSGNNITDNDETGIDLSGSYNTVSGNNITENNRDGIYLSGSNNTVAGNDITANNYNGIFLSGSVNTVAGNNITANNYNGIYLVGSTNTVAGNNITANNSGGIYLFGSAYNNVSGNDITNNSQYGVRLYVSSDNRFWHNNFIDNTQQVYVETAQYANVWDDGYSSGGNYWSNYTGVDEKSGPKQDLPGSDGIGDTPYLIDDFNRDHYPLMNPWTPPEHDLTVSITTPVYLQLGSSTSLSATVTNNGLNNEVNVTFLFLINGTITNSTIIPLLQPQDSYTLNYVWTPTIKGKYNVTAYAPPVLGETFVENGETEFVTVSAPPQIGVKAGDWIRVDYIVAGAPPGTTLPQWLKVEFLSVEGTNVTVLVTMHMSDGTEQNATVPVDVVSGGGAFQGLSGFVIPANCTTGDSVYMSGYGNVTIAGETTSSYAGATRTTVYAGFLQYGSQLTYHWDKLTGAMVEASVISGAMTATAKAKETNMWQATLSGLPIEPIYLYVLAALAIIIVIGVAVFIVRRRKKPSEVEGPQTQNHHIPA